MKKLLTIGALLGLLCGTAGAYVTDAPHNETNDVTCGSCHTYSLWWEFSPTGPNAPNYGQYTDDVCNKCHATDAVNNYPKKIDHSYISMGDTHRPGDSTGDWFTNCIDCHDPHQQAQLQWLEEDSSLASNIFLVTGNITQVTPDPDGNTTIAYDGTSLNFNNPYNEWSIASSNDPEVFPTWENKGRYSARGLILVHDIKELTNSYSIISADNSTIKLRGTPDTFDITDDGCATTTEDSFALIYGQFIKTDITTPGTPSVKFFDPTLTPPDIGGFLDDNDTASEPKGICQVCHNLTKYWLSNGVSGGHFTSPCTDCHDTLQGFKPLGVPHTFITSLGTSCANCHPVDEEPSDQTHSSCYRCHHDTLGAPYLKTDFYTLTGVWPTPGGKPYATGTCIECHDSNGPATTGDIAGDFTNHPNTNTHTGQVTATFNCTDSCHFHKNRPDIIGSIHGENATDPCSKCHDLISSTDQGKLIGSASAGTHGEARDCTTCHGSSVYGGNLHVNGGNHSLNTISNQPQVEAADSAFCECTSCHTNTDLIGVIHKGNCSNCHNTGNYWALIGSATGGPGNCIDCHGENFFIHDISSSKFTYDHNSAGAVSADPNCTACHIEADYITDIHVAGCATCHQADGTILGTVNLTIPVAARTGHGLDDSGNPANTCSTCHTDKTNHPADTDHVARGLTTNSTQNCEFCHTGSVTTDVHNSITSNNCIECHTSLRTDQIRNLQAGVIAGGDCQSCHSSANTAQSKSLTIMFDDHQNAADHTGQVAGNDPAKRDCQICHTDSKIWDVHYWQTVRDPSTLEIISQTAVTCANCHGPDGEFDAVGSAFGKQTGKPALGNNYCTDCHIDPVYINANSHNIISYP